MFENVDGRMNDGVTGILIAHLRAFSSGKLKKKVDFQRCILYICKACYPWSGTILIP